MIIKNQFKNLIQKYISDIKSMNIKTIVVILGKKKQRTIKNGLND